AGPGRLRRRLAGRVGLSGAERRARAVAAGDRAAQAPGSLAPPDAPARRARGGAATTRRVGGTGRRRPAHRRRGAGPPLAGSAARGGADLPRRSDLCRDGPGDAHAGGHRQIARPLGALRDAGLLRTGAAAVRHPRSRILSAFVRGTTDGPRSLLVEAHLALCPACARRVAQERDGGDTFPEVTLHDELDLPPFERVWAAVEEMSARRQ